MTASLKVTRAEGGLPVGAKTTAVATVDGVEVLRQEVVIDALGTCAVTFPLPKEILVGDATLALTVADGGVVETAAKSIPVVVNRVALAIYPEGGDLLAGVPCRVYVEAKTPKQRPADVAGRVLDDRDRLVATLATVHEGRGRFTLVPEEGRDVPARARPAGRHRRAVRAAARRRDGPRVDGARRRLRARRARARVALASRTGEVATVGLYVRERELALAPVQVPAGSAGRGGVDAGDRGVRRVPRDGLRRDGDAAGRAPRAPARARGPQGDDGAAGARHGARRAR